MKNQERAYFGPKQRIEKVGNGLTRKPRKKPRFVSKPLRQLAKEVEMSWANRQSVLENERNRNGIGSENVHPSNHVVPQSKQHHLYGKVGQRNPNAMKEDFSLLGVSPKSRQAILKKSMKPTIMSSTSKMKQGSVHHTNDTKMLSSQPKNLKAMPGLVHISKGRLDQGATTRMHKRDQLNVGNDITNNANNTRKRKELQHEEKPKSQDDNFSEGENPTHIIMKKRRRYIEINEDEDDNVDQSPEVGVDSTRLTSRDGILKDCHDKISVPFVVDCLKEHNNCWSKPIDEPVWR
ncbi:hypothetical protein HU200_027041 [Digitaria exilis]|uniref:Uncharacterized protein n=1 Tax=Digitaria exilis TaxID=1010633 RepID=A0A835BY58_9POAL|nr:hypothetical protein HU200_027041 [Digitaria exilis]